MQRIGGRGPFKACLGASVALLALAAGCGERSANLPPACRQGQQAVAGALASAPGRVRIDTRGGTGGVSISGCMTDGADAGDLQELGAAINGAAAGLAEVAAERPDSAQAVQLGYLAGALKRGSEQTQGLHSELVRRVDQELVRVDRTSAAFQRGERAGRQLG